MACVLLLEASTTDPRSQVVAAHVIRLVSLRLVYHRQNLSVVELHVVMSHADLLHSARAETTASRPCDVTGAVGDVSVRLAMHLSLVFQLAKT